MPVEVVQPVVAMPDAQRRVHGRTAYAIADPTPVSRPSEQPTCMCYKPKQPQQPLREPAAAHYPPPPPVPCPVPRRSRTQCPALPPPDAPPSQCCTHHPAPVSPPLCLPTCNAHAQAWPAAAPVLGKRAWRTGRRRFRSMPTCRLPPCSWVPPTATWQGQPGGCRRTRRCCKVRAPPPLPRLRMPTGSCSCALPGAVGRSSCRAAPAAAAGGSWPCMVGWRACCCSAARVMYQPHYCRMPCGHRADVCSASARNAEAAATTPLFPLISRPSPRPGR